MNAGVGIFLATNEPYRLAPASGCRSRTTAGGALVPTPKEARARTHVLSNVSTQTRVVSTVSRRYARLRRAERTGPDDPVDQEINYNTGRFYHGLGLYSAALNWYLDVSRPRGFFSLAADEPRRHRGPRQDPRRAATP